MHRQVKTLNDMLDLFSDYHVTVQLTDSEEVHITFPKINEYPAKYSAKTNLDTHLADRFNDGIYQPQSLAFSHKAKSAISALVSNPEFWRQTTVADQLGVWAFQQKDYGRVKAKKRANQPLMLVFKSHILARQFYQNLEKTI